MVNIAIQFDELVEAVKQLSDEQKRILIQQVEQDTASHKTERIPGLHAGKIWISDDFDDPLPDEFWLGEDA